MTDNSFGYGFSQSLLKAYACPRRGMMLAKSLKAHGKTTGKGPALVGQAVHSFIAKYLRHCIDEGVLTDLGEADRMMDIAGEYYIGPLYPDYISLCEKFTQSESAPEGMVEIERQIDYRLPVAGIHLHGVPDLVVIGEGYNFVEIIDWKTSRWMLTQEEFEANIQHKLYAMLVALSMPVEQSMLVEEFILTVVYVRYGESRTYTMTAEEVLNFGAEIVGRIARINEMTEFPAQSGDVCTFCEVATDCPEMAVPEHIDDRPISHENRARAMVVQNKYMQKVIKARTALLKAWVEKNGPLTVGMETLDFHPTVKKEYPISETLDVLSDEIDDPHNIMTVQISKVKKAVKDKELLAKVDALAVMTTGTRFELKRLKEVKE